MLARNPMNGKNIRIISLETSFWRDQKTLVWFDEPPANREAAWSRWDIGTTSVVNMRKLAAAGIAPDVVLCLDDFPSALEWFVSGRSKSVRVVVVSKALVEFIGLEKLVSLRMGNLMCVDEMHDMYPFLGSKWDGTVDDAKVMVAMALHCGRTFPIENRSGRMTRGLRVESTLVEPQPLWLLTQYYQSDTKRRRAEIDACLTNNIDSPVIDKIVLLNERACAPKHAKIEETIIGKRLTYADVIRWIYEKAPPNIMVVFANADIFFDAESWRLLWSTDLEKVPKFMALLRWEVETADAKGCVDAKLFGPRADSQDTWVVSSNAVKAVTWDWAALNFPFGKGGCDNAITLEMFKKRFLIGNPALTLKTYHFHSSKVRTYNPRDVVDKDAYLYIHPTGLHDMKPVTSLKDVPGTVKQLVFQAFDRPVRGPITDAQARTFCTMVGRSTQGLVQLDIDAKNTWSPAPLSLHRLSDVFQTRDGLVYTYDSILMGATKASAQAWANSQLSSLSASLSVEDAMVAPLPDNVAGDPARFVLEYMSKVFLLRETFGSESGEFWCSKSEKCVEAIKAFVWPSQDIPVLSREENNQTWCKSAAMWPYQDTDSSLVSMEEVGALRNAFGLGGWKETTTENHLVIVVDSKWVTDDIAEGVEEALEDHMRVKMVWAGRSSLETCLRAMRGAAGMITLDRTLVPWCWVLPKGARVWDVQSEMEPSATLLHTASASSVEHRLVIVPKGTPNAVEKKTLIEKLVRDIKEQFAIVAPVTPPATPKKPTILIPTGHVGFYHHAGDSFREMASIWGERGFVDIVESSTAHQIWMGGIGKILLYDRPTYEWYARAPPAEKLWELALFGNPPPLSSEEDKHGKTSSWSFWPRRPAVVESMVASGTPTRPWESRTNTVVFYGRSENAVQKQRRTGSKWATHCSEFVHVGGDTKYPLSPEEYLEKLASSRFGLCLAGYGNKCHREVECMAMGSVPIVAAEVDMDNYADPPEEGLHYIRVNSADDIPDMLEKITAERWTVMSVACRDWWRRNASVDGMWELTRRLAGV